MCSVEKRCLYGTRDAPAIWEAFYTETLLRHGFRRGLASACVFYHPERHSQERTVTLTGCSRS